MYSADPNPTDYVHGTTATYTCREGFSISAGDEMRACGGNGSSPVGTWSGIEATCSGMSNF